jgi:hypothetical protein
MARDWATARRAGSLGSSRAEGRTRTLQHARQRHVQRRCHVQRRLRMKPLGANPPGGVGAVAGFLLPGLLVEKTTRASCLTGIRRCPEAPFLDGNRRGEPPPSWRSGAPQPGRFPGPRGATWVRFPAHPIIPVAGVCRAALATRSDRDARFGWSVAFSTHAKAPDENRGRGFKCIRRQSLARAA